jgi:hypothetical protein
VSPAYGHGRRKDAHVADPRGCEGRPDAVRIVDQTGASTEAWLRHEAVLPASLHNGRVYPLHGPYWSAILAYTRAQELPPFDFLIGPGIDYVTATDEAAIFPYGPESTLRGSDASALVRRFEGDGNDTRHRGASSRHPVLGQGLNALAQGAAVAGDSGGNGWSGPGNARSSRWIESCVPRLRGSA